NNVGATKEPGEPDHASNAGGKSVWWTWTAPASGGVTLSTSGSSFDTLLAVYIGDSVSNLSVVANNDNNGTNLTSLVSFNAVSNQTYQIAVDGLDGASGALSLALSLKPDEFQISGAPREDFWLPAYGEYPMRLGGFTGNGSIAVEDGMVLLADADIFQVL